MTDHKLFQALQSFSPAERADFLAYVQADFVNQSPLLRQLAEILVVGLEQPGKAWREKEVFANLHPNKAYSQQRLREHFSRLFKLLKSFLAYRELKSEPLQEEVFALRQFRKRQWDKAFHTQLLSTRAQLAASTPRRAEDFRLQAEAAAEANAYFSQQQRRIFDHNLQERVDSLDRFYLITKLRESCDMLNRRHVMNAEYQLHILPQLTQWLEGELPESLRDPAIDIYFHIYLSLKEGKETHFLRLTELLEEHHASFSQEEGRAMYKYAQNYCIRQINQGKPEYETRLFALYQDQLANGRIFTDGQLSHTDYKNIATVGLRVGQYAWVREFLEQHLELVAKEFRSNVYNYCLAAWHLEQGQFQEAIRWLNQVAFTDIAYRISAQYILLKAYFETEEWDSLEYLIRAFGNYLRRTKGISPANRKNHRNFLRILRKLLRITLRRPAWTKGQFEGALLALRQEIEQTPQLPHLEWLQEKSLS